MGGLSGGRVGLECARLSSTCGPASLPGSGNPQPPGLLTHTGPLIPHTAAVRRKLHPVQAQQLRRHQVRGVRLWVCARARRLPGLFQPGVHQLPRRARTVRRVQGRLCGLRRRLHQVLHRQLPAVRLGRPKPVPRVLRFPRSRFIRQMRRGEAENRRPMFYAAQSASMCCAPTAWSQLKHESSRAAAACAHHLQALLAGCVALPCESLTTLLAAVWCVQGKVEHCKSVDPGNASNCLR